MVNNLLHGDHTDIMSADDETMVNLERLSALLLAALCCGVLSGQIPCKCSLQLTLLSGVLALLKLAMSRELQQGGLKLATSRELQQGGQEPPHCSDLGPETAFNYQQMWEGVAWRLTRTVVVRVLARRLKEAQNQAGQGSKNARSGGNLAEAIAQIDHEKATLQSELLQGAEALEEREQEVEVLNRKNSVLRAELSQSNGLATTLQRKLGGEIVLVLT